MRWPSKDPDDYVGKTSRKRGSGESWGTFTSPWWVRLPAFFGGVLVAMALAGFDGWSDYSPLGWGVGLVCVFAGEAWWRRRRKRLRRAIDSRVGRHRRAL